MFGLPISIPPVTDPDGRVRFCWADAVSPILKEDGTWGLASPCNNPAVTDVGLCSIHHKGIVPEDDDGR